MQSALRNSALSAILATTVLTQPAVAETGCQLDYPIVLSHHWSTRKICHIPDETGPNAGITSEECEAREPARYCAGWAVDPNDSSDMDCVGGWRVPADELDLPPRNYNVEDPTLVRDVSTYHRYYSKTIVERLEACGNDVFLSDKPVFATYEFRARALRETVKRALAETGKNKVILIGLSQGSQDARWMTAMLPFDDNDPSKGWMASRVAAVVSTAGEPHGTESASITLDLLYASNVLGGNGWEDYEQDPLYQTVGEEGFNEVFWKKGSYDAQTQSVSYDLDTAGDPTYVLMEGATGNKADMTFQERYNSFLGSLTVLSKRFMTGSSLFAWSWDDLRALSNTKDQWSDAVPPKNEDNNGVQYYSYAAKIQNWNEDDWGTGSEMYLYYTISTLWGENEGYVTVDAQRFDTLGFSNFHHIKTLDGSVFGRGYHHMFFTGRNPIYGPSSPWLQEWAPYQGDAADFYEQLMRDLIARGL